MLVPPVTGMNNATVFDLTEPASPSTAPDLLRPFPLGFRASVSGFLVLEMLLGLSSNLTVLVLYCSKPNLVKSVSNVVTMNLHVLDVMVCVLCMPLTIAVLMLSLRREALLLCCFHEACVSFASVATAANVLAVTVDRYDISVKPANRVLTMGRAVALLGCIWVLSFVSFLVPFVEAGFLGAANGSVDGNGYSSEPGLYYHLVVQIPIFCLTAVVMLATYAKILQALNIRIGTHAAQKKKKKKNSSLASSSQRQLPEIKDGAGSHGIKDGAGSHGIKDGAGSHGIKDGAGSHGIKDGGGSHGIKDGGGSHGIKDGGGSHGIKDGGGSHGIKDGGGSHGKAALGMRTSVSVVIALRRAVRRHRERRERQKRVFRMSLLIVSTFLLCWTPISVLNAAILSAGPGDLTLKLRLGFLALAYGTTVLHPLLYAFTRQKFRKVLRGKMKKRVVSVIEAETLPNGRNSWLGPRRSKKVPLEDHEARQKCLCSEDADC